MSRTFVGLDVHAWSVTGHGLDAVTGEVWQRKLTPDPADIVGWLRTLPQPVQVTYEAGPTGFGLARHLRRSPGSGVWWRRRRSCSGRAGDRVKTDARDAELLARLLKLDEIVEVTVPSVAQEAARDLVRAREDVRGDLMRARHRLSKLLLRQGIVYDRRAGRGPAAHDVWLRSQRFDQPGRQLAFDVRLRDDAAHRAAPGPARRRRSPTMAEDSEYTDLVHRLGCLRGISTLTGFGLAVEIGDWHRFTGSTIGAFLGLVPTEHSSGQSTVAGLDHQDRQQPRPPAAGRGGLAPPQDLPPSRPDHARPLGAGPAGGPGPRPRRQPAAAPALADLHRPPQKARGRQRRHRPRTRRLGLVAGRPGVAPTTQTFLARHRLVAARGTTRDTAMNNRPMINSRSVATFAPRPAEASQPNSPSCGNQPAHISLTARRT